MPSSKCKPCATESALSQYQQQVDEDDNKQNFIEQFIQQQFADIEDTLKGNPHLASFIHNNQEQLADHLEDVASTLFESGRRP